MLKKTFCMHIYLVLKMAWDGASRVIIRSGRNYPSPFGVALYGDYMYWIDYSLKSVRPACGKVYSLVRNHGVWKGL